jgi:hypothetical protein
VALAVLSWAATHSLAGYAEPVATEEQRAGDQSPDDSAATASAGNGGTAFSTSGGEVEIGEIVTGENTGNTIITGNISGSAEISGGEIDYPTDVDVSLNNSPLLADASGGDSNEASATDNADGGANEDGDAATDIKVINKNDNRSSAVITTEPSP